MRRRMAPISCDQIRKNASNDDPVGTPRRQRRLIRRMDPEADNRGGIRDQPDLPDHRRKLCIFFSHAALVISCRSQIDKSIRLCRSPMDIFTDTRRQHRNPGHFILPRQNAQPLLLLPGNIRDQDSVDPRPTTGMEKFFLSITPDRILTSHKCQRRFPSRPERSTDFKDFFHL